jgi:hypothetical protein
MSRMSKSMETESRLVTAQDMVMRANGTNY